MMRRKFRGWHEPGGTQCTVSPGEQEGLDHDADIKAKSGESCRMPI
jgi:hypothetical protein